MPTFASRTDMLPRVNARVLLQLAVPTDFEMPSEQVFRLMIAGDSVVGYDPEDIEAVGKALEVIDVALNDATALMLSYGVKEDATATLLARLCSVIAVYYLRGETNMTDESKSAYESAMKTLKAHQCNEINLNAAPSGATPDDLD